MDETREGKAHLGEGAYAECVECNSRINPCVVLTSWLNGKQTDRICLYPKTLEKFLAFIEKVKAGVKAKKVIQEAREFVVDTKGLSSVARGHVERLLRIIDAGSEEPKEGESDETKAM